MKRVLDEQQEPRLPPSVELKLRQICESKMQPWPDDDVIRQLAALSEESAKETLDKISTTSKPIRTLGGYIKWMIRQQCSAASSPSPSKTVRSAHVQSPGASSIVPRRLQFGTPGEAFGVVEQPGSCNGSCVAHGQVDERFRGDVYGVVEQPGSCNGSCVGHVQVDERSRGEAVSDRSPYCYGSPLKATGSCSYQRLSTHAQVHERSQGEAFNHLPPVRGQSPYSSGSPMKLAGTSSQRLSGPGQLDDGFQGEAFTVLEQPGNNNNTQSPYSPVKVAHTYSCQSKFDGEAFGVVEQPGSCNGSSVAHVQVDERFRGETSNPLPATLCNGQSLCSSPSPYEILSAPSDAYKQFCERFQGVHISTFQTPSASPVTPVQLYKSFQGESIAHSPVLYNPADHGQAHLEALGELEFRKQFLILSYAGGTKLKDVIDAEDIRNWKNLPMVKFETTVWHVLGEDNVGKADRLLNVDWDSGRTHFYECHVTRDGSYTFKGPYIKHERRTLLQKLSGDDNVLIVKFDGEGTKTGSSNFYVNDYCTYMKLERDGIFVGLRRYRFFGYKDGGKVDKIRTPSSSPVKCYFVLVSSDAAIDRDVDYWLSNRTIHEGRRLIMHIDTLPSVDKVMARLPLIFSKTTSLELDWSVVKVETIDDIYCLDDSGNHVYNRDGKALIHTDGTGFISEDLALLCPRIAKRKFTSEEHMEGLLDPDELEIEMTKSDFRTQEAPLLIQCRLFHEGTAAKGTLVVNKLLPPKTLQIRPSMIKVEKDEFSDTKTINSLEIVCTSAPPMKAYLSRTIIALLVYGGVPKDLFMKILENAVEDAHYVISKTRAALKVAEKYGGIDDFLVETMIRLGIPIEESYLQYRLSGLMCLQEGTGLRKGRLHIPDSYMLMGTADPTGILERDEVCVILKDGQLSGTVLVYRHPGLHFGDIKVLKATYVKELESVVGDARYAIFFSCNGPRNVADEIAGGDFDGDLYWVSRNPQLLKWYKPSEPWNEGEVATQKVDSKRPTELSDEDLQAEMFRLFLKNRFQPCFAMGEASNNWTALMDKFLTLGDSQEKKDIMNKMLRLVDIYYIALDAAKKGVKVDVPKDLKVSLFPHYMDKLKEEKTETSSSILGEIYDGVDKCQAKLASLTEIKKLPIFDINQVPKHCLNNWRKLYEQYRGEMSSAMKNANRDQAAISVIGYYKEKLYNAADFEHSSKPIDAILDEAHAIYHVCYDYAINIRGVQRCSFAWKVAGKALCELHAKKTGEKWLSIAPSVLQQLL